MRLRRPVVAAAVALATAAAVPHAAAPAAGGSPACTADDMRLALRAFVSAFDRGETARLDALFAEPPLFGWYSSNAPGLRRAAAARDRATLLAYFRGRHARHDRLRLVAFTFNGSAAGLGNAVFRMRRSASDYRRGAWFGVIGKAAASCDGGAHTPVRFVVFSLGGAGSG